MLNKRRDPESQTTLSLTCRTKSKRSRASAQIDESRLTISMLSECDRSPNMGESQSLAPVKYQFGQTTNGPSRSQVSSVACRRSDSCFMCFIASSCPKILSTTFYSSPSTYKILACIVILALSRVSLPCIYSYSLIYLFPAGQRSSAWS